MIIKAVHKVDDSLRFTDLSDYMRPLADRLVIWLLNTPITPVQVTLAYGLVGAVSGWLVFQGSTPTKIAGAILLMLKNLLDSVDGGLARTRRRPSRVGRLLDSLSDFFINAWVLYAMAPALPALAFAALLSITFQGTFYNYFTVLYRHATGGDTTSAIREGWRSPYPYDRPFALVPLVALYYIVYGWQDAIARKVDSLLTQGKCAAPPAKFLTLASVFGLGVHLAVMTAALIAGKPLLALIAFVGPFNLFLGILLFLRARQKRLTEAAPHS
jgi:phosphatidylglycerophosphate synthase